MTRMALRKIPYDLPGQIYEKAVDRFEDIETGYRIAVMEVEFYGRLREVMLAYALEEENAKLITIHPLKDGQKQNRITTGRWRKLE